jgi:tRNA dimethylallyltransferase
MKMKQQTPCQKPAFRRRLHVPQNQGVSERKAHGEFEMQPAKNAGPATLAAERPLLAIIGATGSGKSALAIAVARKLKAEILTVDSMQIYQGMDIGTAKPSLLEQHEIPHHLINWLRPDEQFSVARFVELADKTILEAQQRDVHLIATGGTPLYFKSLFDGLFEGPSADEDLRRQLRELSLEDLHARLRIADPIAAERIHPQDSRRMIRALEVFQLTGVPISSLQQQWEKDHAPRHKVIWVGLSWDREALNRRINLRVKDMIAAGWLDEIHSLLRSYPILSYTAQEATGYAELLQHVRGQMPLEDAIERIKMATRQLARRQMKWFRRFPNVHWLQGEAPPEENAQIAIELWNQSVTGHTIPLNPRA